MSWEHELFALFDDLEGQASALWEVDREAELHLSFTDAAFGVTTAVNLVSDAPCSTCGGTGAAPGSAPVVCSNCGGRGVLDDNQGFFSFSQPCPACRGRGVGGTAR